VVGIDPEAPDRLREMWQRDQEIAHQNDTPLTPQSFAKMIVDEHFVGPKGRGPNGSKSPESPLDSEGAQ